MSEAPEMIAVVGMGCRFPGANTPDELWANLRSGVESITFREHDSDDPRFVAAKGILDQADSFDAGFFGVSPREAALMDPQQRVFLETAWTALEAAGYDSRNYAGRIGVFAGSILSVYLVRNLWPNRDLVAGAGNFQIAVGNDPTFLATSTSYQLDLRGPSVSVGTACSTSLVAVHLACQSLLAYESDMALAGGVSVHLPLEGGYRYEDGGVLSPDGHCRPFDADAQGTVSSDGAGVVVLKRLSDAIADGDTIHAIIRGSAINNDGRLKVGYTAPSGPGEAQVIAEAMAMAGVSPDSISLIEAHGAGTLLGDPIEVGALVEAFGDCGGKRSFCALGSVKSNIGHVDSAAGIAGLLKTVLALRHGEIPPTLHYQRPNPQIDFAGTPFYVNSDLRPMTRGNTPLRAGVNSFGIGGTNVHVVLEEPPVAEPSTPASRPFELLVLSARTPAALEAATDRLAEYLEQPHSPLPASRGEGNGVELADVAFTLRHGRRPFPQRRIVVAANREEAIAALRARDPQRIATGAAPSSRPTVAFMFPGLGDHYAGMGWELYCTETTFRESIDRSAELLKPHLGSDIRDFLYSGRDWSHPVLGAVAQATGLDLRAMLGRKRGTPTDDQPAAAQPGIFVTELALAELLRSWGIEPEAMIGHSIGEFTAACVAGVLSLPDALEVVATRARLIQSRVSPGAMMAVPLTEEELTPLLPNGVSLGAINAARLCVASGEESGIAALAATLAERGVSCQRLRSTHAYHSHMMETLVEPLLAVLERVELHAPRIPYVSCITGNWITDAEATDPKYWARHLCRTVRFHDGLVTLLEDPRRVFAEVGPGQGLTSHAIAERRENPVIPTMRWSYGLQSELAVLLRGVGQLWISGASLDTSRFLGRERQRRVPLPTYPFERQRYWIEPPEEGAIAAAQPLKKRDVADWFYLPSWKPSVRPRSRADVSGNVLVFADRNGAGTELARQLRERGANVTTVEAGTDVDYETLLRETKPATIVHLWSLTPNDTTCPSASRFAAMQELGYSSVMRIVQALAHTGLEGPVRLEIVANHLNEVTGSELIVPEKATLRAPAMVAPQEHPGLVCRVIDTDDPARILDEIRCEPTDSVVAYRRGMRWIPSYEQVQLQSPLPAAASSRWGEGQGEGTRFRPRGVYLLTGGLGGVGMVLARHLAQTVEARLVLIGRTAPNDEKLAQIHALEELGAEVMVIAADVSHHDEMRRALKAIDDRFGELHGVIHGAGAVGIETFREIREATDADSEKQFVAKVRGVMALDEVLADRQLDFVLLMSSLSAILGGLGFSAYSAANLFMDSFARWKNREGGTRWTSVDWDSWRLGDTRPVIAGLGATVSEFVMEPEEGTDACERILAERNLGQVVVSSGDLQARLRTWITRREALDAKPASATHERPNLSTSFEAPRGELERDLAAIWQELFGVAAVGVHDNFFELGGHSLLATQLNARLSSKLHVEMSLAALLQAPTIAELAIAIVEHQAESTDAATLEQMLAELGDLSLATGGSDE
jgi:acyl transferase domain-containing protein